MQTLNHYSLWEKVKEIRDIIKQKLPDNSIVAEHTNTEHFYRCNLFNGSPLYNSVTTKTGVISESYLKGWAVKTALTHIQNNQARLPTEFETVLEEAKEQHKEIFKNAGEMGTEVHNAVEAYINKWIDDEQQPKSIRDFLPEMAEPKVVAGVLAAEKFMRSNMVVPIHSELLVASEKLQVAGTLDFLALVGTVIKQSDRSGTEDFYRIKLNAKDALYFECVNTGKRIKYELAIIDWKTSNSIDKPHYVLQVSTYAECLKEVTGLAPKYLTVVRLDKQTGEYENVVISEAQSKRALKTYKLGINVLYEWLNSQDSKLIINKQRNVLQV